MQRKLVPRHLSGKGHAYGAVLAPGFCCIKPRRPRAPSRSCPLRLSSSSTGLSLPAGRAAPWLWVRLHSPQAPPCLCLPSCEEASPVTGPSFPREGLLQSGPRVAHSQVRLQEAEVPGDELSLESASSLDKGCRAGGPSSHSRSPCPSQSPEWPLLTQVKGESSQQLPGGWPWGEAPHVGRPGSHGGRLFSSD